jgi:dienelactone hydrolase
LSDLVLTVASAPATAEIKTETVTYKVGDTTFKGFLVYDDSSKDKRPGVMVVHEWWGVSSYERKRAEQLARLGYVALAVDMYGEGKHTEHPKEAAQMAGMVRKDKKDWFERGQAGLKVLRDHPLVDSKKLAAMGYCFGGSTALHLAHNGADLAAVASFHGALPMPSEDEAKSIKAKVLICHGSLDKFIPEETIQKFRAAYDQAKVDYELAYFGGAVHSFTVRDADKRGVAGLAYNEAADRRSWQMMKNLFEEAFGK